MSTRKGSRLVNALVLASAIPFLIQAYDYGSSPGYTGAPGDNPASCTACHAGKLNGGPGKLSVVLPAGNMGTYIPGQKLHLMIQLVDTTEQAAGFQATARMGTGGLTQAGDFAATDANTQVICGDGSPSIIGSPCPAEAPLEYVDQTFAAYTATTQASPAGNWSWSFDWTPPVAENGPITVYAAAVAGPGNPPVTTKSNVYTTSIVLAPGPAPTAPLISDNGVVPLFSTATTVQPGSWFSIYGANFAAAPTVWHGDFPTSLGGVSVTVNGRAAYLLFVSPTQINAQAPDDTATGTVNVVVTNGGQSATGTVTLGTAGPSFSLLDNRHVAAIALTPGSPGNSGLGYDIIGPSTGFPFPARPAVPGEIVTIFGVGFGPTSPPVLAGKIFSGSAPLISLPQMTIGGVPVAISYGGITEAGLYQFNLVVPAAGSGDQVLQAIAGGLSTPESVYLTLQ